MIFALSLNLGTMLPLHVACRTISCNDPPSVTRMLLPHVGLIVSLQTPAFRACPWSRLVIHSSAHREFKATNTACQLSVDLGVGVESVVDTTALLLVQDHLQDLASVLLCSESLSNNLDRVDHIGEDGLVDSGQGSAARALLSLRGAGSVGALGARQDAAGCEDQDVAVGELLLELTGQALLDLVEAGEERNGDEDDNGTLAVADLELTSGDELKRSQGRLEVWVGCGFWGCNGDKESLLYA